MKCWHGSRSILTRSSGLDMSDRVGCPCSFSASAQDLPSAGCAVNGPPAGLSELVSRLTVTLESARSRLLVEPLLERREQLVDHVGRASGTLVIGIGVFDDSATLALVAYRDCFHPGLVACL